MQINTSPYVDALYSPPEERHDRRVRVQRTIERLSRSARGGGPLTLSQVVELDALVRELSELDAADLLDER